MDKDGVIQYIDIHDIDLQPSNDVLFAELARISPDSVPVEAAPVSEELPQGGVVMYCNSWCPDCKKARAWLSDNKIEFQAVDVVLNKHAANQVREWADGNLVTPTFDIDGTIVVDWNPERMAELLLK